MKKVAMASIYIGFGCDYLASETSLEEQVIAILARISADQSLAQTAQEQRGHGIIIIACTSSNEVIS